MPKTIALTGATGFIGGHILAALTLRGHQVRALSRRPVDTAGLSSVEWIKGSLTDPAVLDCLVQDADAVIHCAGAVKAARRADFFDANEGAVVALTEAILRRPGGPPPLLHFSSLAAREPQLSPYAASKAAGEQALARHGGALDWLVVRPPAVYGPGDFEILKLFKSLRYGLGFLPSARTSRVSVVYVEDLATFAADWAENPTMTGHILEVDDGAPEGYRLGEIYRQAAALLDRDVRLVRIPSPLLTMAAQINTAMARLRRQSPMLTRGKVRELTHPDWVCHRGGPQDSLWQPRTRLPEGLKSTLDWYRQGGML